MSKGLLKAKSFACQPPFRGSIADNCKRFKFNGAGYASLPPEQKGHFTLESARQIAGPLESLIDKAVRVTHIIGATQVLKSMCGDCWVMYVLEHWMRSMLVLFEDEEKAALFCSMRLMDTIRRHQGIAPMLAEASKESRHNVAGTWIKFPGASLLVAGMNEGNVSTLSWPVIWISEAWQHGNDGLLFKAFKRADRFASTSKILNESQASLVGTDLHTAVKTAHQVPLTWKCPACDGEQTWEWKDWSHKRPDDFVPRPQKHISQAIEIPKAGTFAGMKFGLENGETDNRTIEEKARAAYWVCIWCGHHIHDIKETRRAIAETYNQDYKILANGITRTPAEVCFTIPFEANVDNKFEKTVAKFLAAKEAKNFGNAKPLEDWFLADRAFFYDPIQEFKTIVVSPGSYDPARFKEIMGDDFHSVNMAVDCQQDQDVMDKTGKSITGWFWYAVRAMDKFGNSKQLARGFAKSWDEWIKVQKFWSVPNDRVCIDVGQWGTQIATMAAQQRETIKLDKPTGIFRSTQKIVTWYLLSAENTRKGYPHSDGNLRPWSPPQPIPVPLIDAEGKSRRIFLNKIRFDRDTFNLQLDALWSGAPSMPKFEILSREFLDEQSKAMETGDRTYSQQLNAKIYNKEKRKYEELRPDDHFQWVECALLVRAAMDGLFGASISSNSA